MLAILIVSSLADTAPWDSFHGGVERRQNVLSENPNIEKLNIYIKSIPVYLISGIDTNGISVDFENGNNDPWKFMNGKSGQSRYVN